MGNTIKKKNNVAGVGGRANGAEGGIAGLLVRCYDEGGNDGDSLVSIRCLRHKRRFNVPKSWTNTCAWLCPKCYAKLTEEERNRYAPKTIAHVRKAESPLPSPMSNTESAAPKARCDTPNDTLKKKTKPANKEQPKPTFRKKELHIEKIVEKSSAAIPADLRPRYRIECRKCGEIAPCHKSWFDTSVVLCPSCYSSMPKADRLAFEANHPPSEAKLYEVEFSNFAPSLTYDFKPIRAPRSWATEVKACSEYFITKASKYKLMRAVQEGRLSRVRARIELARRNRADYYKDMPSVDIPIV